eukprot:CAMPEP_0197066752 /NCGR_PEP_ID=MMETSP1384-20130603/175850_1 /TAXON_ID=29189 /ORGANISM="Ammonia sp." /LENGTH=96 /DNA_ID=CAMNT_0042504003 /DNA_START=27 /DNA_END=313 /DNA_ORIENTATION=+
MLLLAGIPYANNFASLWVVFFYGLFLGESIEHLIDSEQQFRVYVNRRLTALTNRQLNGNAADRLTPPQEQEMRDVINRQYDHKPVARCIPMLLHMT